MKKHSILSVVFFLFTGSLVFAQETIPVNEFEKSIQSPGIQILDVRTAGEFNSGHIKNALQADWNNRAQFNDRTQYLDKSKPVYVYCLSGGRSAAATAQLRQQGYTAFNLEGGITAWKKAGKPLEGLHETARITAEQYNTLAKSAKLVMIDFGADWCPPCKKMEPVVNDIRKNMKQKVTVQFVDGGSNTELMNAYKVEALPTFIIYRQGKEVWRKQGVIAEADLVAVINSFQ